MSLDPVLWEDIRLLVEDLAAGRYSVVVPDDRAGRISVDELRAAITDYGQTLRGLPEDAWMDVDVYPHDGAPNTFAVDVPLWTIKEGRSDLTLSLTATFQEGVYVLCIDDLHVL